MNADITPARLHTAIAAVCPIAGVSIGTLGQSASVTFQPQAGATQAQQTAAQNAINGFDWSDAADQTYLDTVVAPERAALKNAAANAVANNSTYLAIGNPNNAQVVAQVRALTQQNNAIIQRLIKITI